MSLSWNSVTVRVHLGTGYLAACVLQGRGRRSRVVDKQIFPLAPDRRAAALEALAPWLERVAPRVSVGWVLGHRDVRYLMLPWASELADSKLCDAVARTLLSQRFGLDPSQFEVRLAAPRHGRARLAAFVDRDVLADITSHARRSRRRLTGIEPGVAVVWRRFAGQFPRGRGVVRLIDGDRQIVVAHDGTCLETIALAPEGPQEGEWATPSRLGETRRLFSSNYCSNLSTDKTPDAVQRLVLPGLPGFDAMADAPLAYALCGVP